MNIGGGGDVTLADLARPVARVVGYTGEIGIDTGKADGTPRKLTDVGLLTAAGRKARTGLDEGFRSADRGFVAASA